DDDRRGPRGRLREEREAQREHPERADLVEDADEERRRTGGSLLGGVRQPRVDGEHRRLDREREEEAEEHQTLRGLRHLDADEVLDEEALRAARSLEEERDDRDQHHEATGEREQQELHRGAAAL